jgi:nucleotide-binding universal stress UspA family protein
VLHSVLVPLDGSLLAEEALPIAAALAEQNKASLSLTVVHPWGPAEDVPRRGTRADRELRDTEGLYLNRLIQRLAAVYRLTVYEAVLDGAPTGETLERYIRRRNIDLVVASTHNHGILGRFLSTGVARFLARYSRSSVLFIKPQVAPLPATLVGFKRIVLALDGTSDPEVSLEAAADLAAPDGGTITLLRVVTEIGELPEARTEAGRYLEQLAVVVRRRGHRVNTAVVPGDNVVKAILSYAEEEQADLIVLTTRKRPWLSRSMFGSVADALIPKATVPVLVCHVAPDSMSPSDFPPV